MFRTALAVVALCAGPGAFAQIPGDLDLVPVVTAGLSSPIGVRHAGDGSGRLFIFEKGGAIKIFKNGALNATPFLTLPVSTSSEQGLLGLAFHPNYENNGMFYVAYTRATADPGCRVDPDELACRQAIARFSVSAGDADIANPASRTEIMSIADRAGNHNGGDLAFGPDGNLYWAMGDGGEQGDPNQFAQFLWTRDLGNAAYSLLGKVVRINVDGTGIISGEMCGAGTGPYTIPSDNPHIGTANSCDEIWHYGMRNPWRINFDRRTGESVVGDVGQGTWEEMNVRPARTPSNFGWRCFEANATFSSTGLCSPPATNIVGPVLAYQHNDGGGGFRCSISGGYRYRGPIFGMHGVLTYADYCSGEVWLGVQNPGTGAWTTSVWRDTNRSVVGFGEDEIGHLYVIDLSGGVYRFSSASDNNHIFGHGAEG